MKSAIQILAALANGKTTKNGRIGYKEKNPSLSPSLSPLLFKGQSSKTCARLDSGASTASPTKICLFTSFLKIFQLKVDRVANHAKINKIEEYKNFKWLTLTLKTLNTLWGSTTSLPHSA